MFSFIRTVYCYILLLLYRWGAYNSFLSHVLQHCRRRQLIRINLPGLPDTLDEITSLPDDVTDDLEFIGFNADGIWLSFRVQRRSFKDRTTTYSHMLAEIPDVGTFRYENDSAICGTADKRNGGRKLSLAMDKAMRHWRVQFNGPLEAIGSGHEDVHGVISLYWQCTSDPFSHWSTPTTWQLAKSVSGLGIAGIKEQLHNTKQISYEQWGQLWGRIHIEGHEVATIRLMSCKRREMMSIERERTMESVCSTYSVTKVKGVQIMYSKALQGNKTTGSFGFVTYPISASHLADVCCKSDDDTVENQLTTVKLRTSKKVYSLNVTARKHSVFDKANRNRTNFVIFDMNGHVCYGIETVRKNQDFLASAISVCHKLTHNLFDGHDDTMLVSLDDIRTTKRDLVGGKCASLGILTRSGFRVPQGLCLTVNAFEKHVYHNSELNEAITQIHTCLENFTMEKLQLSCSKAVKACIDSELRESLKMDIRKELVHYFGTADDVSLAVRSSALSEDGTEASTAGQLDTVLGVCGLGNVFDAILKCWASSLAFQVVEYRRQNGQPLTEPVAILLQEMVAADTAGVLFTNDPRTGNSCVMVASAAPGIGELVVSGSVNPDTIHVRRQKRNLDMIDYVPGDKYQKLVLNPTGGVQQIAITEHERNKECLNKIEVLGICELGLQIEDTFDKIPQDIEWAIGNNEIYILQSRSIIRTDIETDEEIAHEFESPVASDEIYVTSCNTVEACPEVLTPLNSASQDVLAEAGIKNYCSTTSATYYPQFPDVIVFLFTQRFLINISAWDYMSVKLFGNKMDIELGLTGHVIKENTNEMVLECFGESHSGTLWKLILFISSIFRAKRMRKDFDNIWAKAESITFDEHLSAKELYVQMYDILLFLRKAWYTYFVMMNESSKWAGILVKILLGVEEPTELPLRVKSDVALLLADCPDVVSADIPRSLEQLVKQISESTIKEIFITSSAHQLHDLILCGDHANLKTSYTRFLKQHGHRGPMEFEFSAKSWAMNPEPLMETIQQMVRQGQRDIKRKAPVGVDEAVDNIETELTNVKRYLLKKMIVPYARSGVSVREMGKSMIVKSIDAIKRGYWTLARQLVREGRLPEEKLVFYFTHEELGELIETRSPTLIRRAKRRIKVIQIQDATTYPTIFAGRPANVSSTVPELPASFTLTGMPVCRGKIMARARVIQKLKEANTIQNGETLITPTTCVGWSPYFPMLGGLVTEVGGLISHGAVIAREYGIPCVVCVAGATKVFSSGDMIELDGTAGTVKLLK